jgi:hypothetical protein
VPRSRFYLNGEKFDYELRTNIPGLLSRYKEWNSFTVELVYRSLIRGIDNGYVDLYFAPELTTHWGKIQEPGINSLECLKQFMELEESIISHVQKLASMVLGKAGISISWQKTGWQSEAMPSYGGDCIWLNGMIRDK